MYSSDLFRQINKVIDNTVKVNIIRPFQSTAPFLLKQAQSPNNAVGRNVPEAPSKGIPYYRQVVHPVGHNELPSFRFNYRFRDNNGNQVAEKPWSQLERLSVAASTIPPRTPEQDISDPNRLRLILSHTGSSPTHFLSDKVVGTMSSPDTTGRPSLENSKDPLPKQLVPGKRTGFKIIESAEDYALDPKYGFSGPKEFNEVLTQAEKYHQQALDNLLTARESGAPEDEIKKLQAELTKAETYLGSLYNLYHNFLNKPLYHNFHKRKDSYDYPVYEYYTSDLKDVFADAARNAFWLRIGDYGTQAKNLLADREANFYRTLFTSRKDSLLKGHAIPVNDINSLAYSLVNSNIFSQDETPTQGSKLPFDFELRPEDQLSGSKFGRRFFLEEANENGISGYLPQGARQGFLPMYAPIDTNVYGVDPNQVPLLPSNFNEVPAFVTGFSVPRHVTNPPSTINIRPQVHRELPPVEGTENQNRARNVIRDTLKDPTISRLTELSVLARAGYLEPNSVHAVPFSANPNNPFYMKVQYIEPTRHHMGETLSTGPSYLQPVTAQTEKGNITPVLYVLSTTFVPTRNGIRVRLQEIPTEAVDDNTIKQIQDNPATNLKQVDKDTITNHFLSVVQEQLMRHGQYDRDNVSKYANYILSKYSDKNISSAEDIASFIRYVLSVPTFPGDENVKNAVLANFALPGKIVVNPNTGKLYFNTGDVAPASATNTSK
jgi:hypothetical protein